jgi:HK97 family phage major capsid protein
MLDPNQRAVIPVSVLALLSLGREYFSGAVADANPDPLAQAEAIIAQAAAEGRDILPSEETRVRLHIAQAERAPPPAPPVAEEPPVPAGSNRRTAPDPMPDTTRVAAHSPVGHVGVRDVRRLFARSPDPTRGRFRDVASFLNSVIRHPGDERLIAASAMTTGGGATGGFLVPAPMLAEVWQRVVDVSAFAPFARLFTIPAGMGGGLIIPARDDATPADGPDGSAAQWLAEAEAATRQPSNVRRVTLALHKIAAYVSWSLELEEDSATALEPYLGENIAQRVADAIDNSVIRGTGAGQPLGILNSPALITVAAVGSQTADTLTAANILAMASRLHAPLWNSARWWVHPSCIPMLARLTSTALTDAGAAVTEYGSGFQVVSFDGTTGEWRILGRPVSVTDKCGTLGDVGDIVLAAMGEYALGMGAAMTLERSNAPGWLDATFDLRAIARADGTPLWNAPLTRRNGGTTASAFVTLAAR